MHHAYPTQIAPSLKKRWCGRFLRLLSALFFCLHPGALPPLYLKRSQDPDSASGSWFRSSFHPWAWRQRSPESANRKEWKRNERNKTKLSSDALPMVSQFLRPLSVHLRFTYLSVSPFLIWKRDPSQWLQHHPLYIFPIVWPVNQLTSTLFLLSETFDYNEFHRKVQPHDLDLLTSWPLLMACNFIMSSWCVQCVCMCVLAASFFAIYPLYRNKTWHGTALHSMAQQLQAFFAMAAGKEVA